MLSYEERLNSFKNWPKQYKPEFIRKLAVLGQFSDNEKISATECVFCSKKLEEWQPSDVPIYEHMAHNEGCLLYELNKKGSRAKFNQLMAKCSQDDLAQVFLRADDQELLSGEIPFINYPVKKGVNFIFCACCGETRKAHSCAGGTVKKMTERNIKKPQFYMDLLSGKYMDALDAYLENQIFIPAELSTEISDVMKQAGAISPFETIEEVFLRGVKKLTDDLEKTLCGIEKEALLKLEKI